MRAGGGNDSQQKQQWTKTKEVEIMKKKTSHGPLRANERKTERQKGCRVQVWKWERSERKGKGGKWGKENERREVDGQIREKCSRAGRDFEARERANRGPCFTNCHFRGANGGMKGGKRKMRQPQTGSRLHTARDVLSRTLHHAHMGERTNTTDPDTGRQRCTPTWCDG